MRRHVTEETGPVKAENHVRHLQMRVMSSESKHGSVSFQYFVVASKRAAMILQVIVDAMRKEGRKYESMWRDGAFLVTTDFLQQKLGLDRGAQDRYLVELKRKGFVQTTRHGLPARRYVRVDFEVLEQAIALWNHKWDAIRDKRVEITLPDVKAMMGQDGATD